MWYGEYGIQQGGGLESGSVPGVWEECLQRQVEEPNCLRNVVLSLAHTIRVK